MVESAPEDHRLLRITENAPWLPPGGRAEAFRSATPPRPMCVVRLLLRRGDEVFCTDRPDAGGLDLPMRTTTEEDPYGVRTIAELADEVTDSPREAVFIGAVRNVVAPESSGYPWPTPSAFFGVWTVDTSPAVDGVWLPIGSDSSPLQQKHWYPIVSAD